MSRRVIILLAASWACLVVTIALVAVMPEHWTSKAWTIAVVQWLSGVAGLVIMARAVWLARQEARS